MLKFIRFRGSANQATMDNHFMPVAVIASGRWDYLISHWWNAVTEDLRTVTAVSKKTRGVSEETLKEFYSSILTIAALWVFSFSSFSNKN